MSTVSFWCFSFTVYPSAKFPILFKRVAFIANIWLLYKADRKSFFSPLVWITQYEHQLIHENKTDIMFESAKMWVPGTWLSWDTGKWLHATCRRQWLSAQRRWLLHSGVSFIHLSPLYLASQAQLVGRLDRADSSSAFNWRHNWLAHLAKQGN